MAQATLTPIVRHAPSAYGPKPLQQSATGLIGLFLIPALVLTLRFLPSPLRDAAYGITFFYALTGRRQAVISLLLLVLLNLATHAFGLPPALAALYRHPIVAAAAFSTLFLHNGRGSRVRTPSLVFGTMALCVLIFLHSLFFSQIPVLSMLKAFSFSMAILALLTGWSGLSDSERRLGEIQLWGIVGGLTVLSAPMLGTPLGYLRGTGGFQGLTTQPQAFGPMMAVFASFLWMVIITRRKLTVGLVFLACMATAYVYLSRARISALTLVVGLFAGIVLSPLVPALNRLRIRPRMRPGRIAIIGACISLALIVFGSLFIDKAKEFLIKYGSADQATSLSDVADEVYKARQGPLELMLASVKERPLTGIGFGVPTEGGLSTAIVYDPVFGLPIMATVEKGVMPVALMEELGIPLALIVFLWLGWLFALAAKGGTVSLAAFSATLGVNFAESCFFSPGGAGLYYLVIACMAVTSYVYLPTATGQLRR
jgi:hypothetical protein